MSRTIHTLSDIWIDGAPLRLRDLAHVTGYSEEKIRLDIRIGHLKAIELARRNTSPILVRRSCARAWLTSLGLTPRRVAGA